MNSQYLELYTDYLISNALGYATATGLSAMVEGEVSHDQITRFLSERPYSSKDLWREVKSTVRQIEQEQGCLIFDDTIQEKPWTDENELMCWHYDHCQNRMVRGINLLNALYYAGDMSIPVAFEVVRKPIEFSDLQTRQRKRASEVTKNELVRQIILRCLRNQLQFAYVLLDSGFACTETFVRYGKHFIARLKSNRLVALSEHDKKHARFSPLSELELPPNQAVRGFLKGFNREVLLLRLVFTNQDGSTAAMTLVCSDLSCEADKIATLYQKRWKIEEFHKSLKSNAALAKSPTRTVTTQNNHIFLSIVAVFKLECLKIKHPLNHFALRYKLLIKATQLAFAQLQKLKAA